MGAVITEAIRAESDAVQAIGSDYEIKYGFHVPEDYFFKSGRGLSHELVDAISSHKNEPDWMRKSRHRSLDYFNARPLPTWGGDLTTIDFDNIYYYIRPTEKQASSWEELPADIKDTWDRLGIPEAEKNYLAGVGAQYESEVVYHKLQEISPSRACSSWTWTRACASTKRSSVSTSARSSR